MSALNILMVQMSTLVGELAGITQKVLDAIAIAEQMNQAPIAVRTMRRGFGRDRRYPITSGWRP